MSDQPDYDSPWKDILERFFFDFVGFFFPDVHAGIDWDKEYTFMDKELQQLVRDSEIGRRLADKLVRVHTRDGSPLLVLTHIEVQGAYERDFAERIYVYNYRIYDKFRCPVVSLAVLTDESPGWRPASFGYKRWGFHLEMKFPMTKLLDYNDAAALEHNPNPFAIVVMAHLKTLETRHTPRERFAWKWHLIMALYNRGYKKQDVIHLFQFIDWIMTLPDELKISFSQRIIDYEEDRKMRYVSSVEEYILEKNMEKGMEKGMLAEAREMVAEVLSTRFSQIPEKIVKAISAIEDRKILKEIHKKAILTQSLEQFESEFKNYANC
jgi:hypothetical protein